MRPSDAIAHLREANPKAVLFVGCDHCVIGTATVKQLPASPVVAVYSRRRLVAHFTKLFSADVSGDDAHEDAEEWIEFNVEGGYYGDGTPIIVDDC